MGFLYILDTNVLLDNPRAIYDFPDGEIIIPHAVLTELDKIKTSLADKRIRFRGREISRILFELSEEHKLTEGVEIENGSTLKIMNYDPSKPLPESMKTKNTDDQIIALAYQIKKQRPSDEVVLVTNDLNMLLKAQTYDIQAQRPKEQVSGWSVGLAQFFRTQKKTIIWAIILVSAITSAAIFVRYYYQPNQTEIPPELLARLEPFQIKEYAYRQTLTKNPNDLEALIDLGNLYFDNKMYQLAINTYQRALDIDPKNYDVRTDTAIAYFYAGATDTAIEELQKVLEKDPNHAMAYYNMGIVQWHGKNDLDKAIESFNKYLEIQPNGRVADQAKENIKEITALQQDGGNK